MPPFDKDEWVQLRFGSDLGHYSFIGKKMKGGFIVEARFTDGGGARMFFREAVQFNLDIMRQKLAYTYI